MLTEIVISSWIKKIEIKYGFKSDHSCLECEIDMLEKSRGRGVWKLNNLVLSEIEYCEMIKDLVQDSERNSMALNPAEKWEATKLLIIEKSMKYCKERAKNKRIIISQLQEVINKWQPEVNAGMLRQEDMLLYERSVKDYEEIIEEKAKGARFRCKSQYYSEAETNSRYFFNLEKSRVGARGMDIIIDEMGNETRDREVIMWALKDFYKNLYTKDEQVEFTYKNDTDVKINEGQKKLLDADISMQELEKAIKGMK